MSHKLGKKTCADFEIILKFIMQKMCQIRVFESILNHPWMPSSSWHTAKTGTQKRVLEKDQLLSKYCCIKNGFSWSEVNKWQNKYRITILKQRHSAMWTSSCASTPTSNVYWCVDIAPMPPPPPHPYAFESGFYDFTISSMQRNISKSGMVLQSILMPLLSFSDALNVADILL